MSLFIRSLTVEDFDVADTILTLAYNTKGSLRGELERFFSLQSDSCWLLVTLDDVSVGLGGVVDYGAYAYIGLVAIHPEAQRLGLGGRLMARLLYWLESRKCPIVLLEATEAGAPLYERLGFMDDGATLIFQQREQVRYPFPTQHVFPLCRTDLPELVAFDSPIFGAKREAVFAAYLDDFPERAFITRDETGRITGYLFAQFKSIGPWIAQGSTEAEALLVLALSLSFQRTPDVILPAANTKAIQLLTSYGFNQRHSYRHMRRGGTSSPVSCTFLYGQASPAIG